MKTILLLSLLYLVPPFTSQDKMITKIGTVTFEASIPSFEEVKATNQKAICKINLRTGEITSWLAMKDFKFQLALMEAHFNDSFLETKKYPKAFFKGRILDFNYNTLTNKNKEYNLKGKLEIHGKTKIINTIAQIKKTENGILFFSVFVVNTDDFSIRIPLILQYKIANKVIIRNEFNLVQNQLENPI